MTGGELLVAGKALIWFVIPLAFAVWDLRQTERARQRRLAEKARRDGARAARGNDANAP